MKFNQTFSILFRLNYSKKNSKGLVPIWVRITIDGKRAECSVQRQILPEQWDLEKGEANSTHPQAVILNEYLSMVRADISKHYNILLVSKGYVTAEDVKRSYQGIKEVTRTFLDVFKQYNQHLLGGERSVTFHRAGIIAFLSTSESVKIL